METDMNDQDDEYKYYDVVIDTESGSVIDPPLNAAKDEIVYPLDYFKKYPKKVDIEIPESIIRGTKDVGPKDLHKLVSELISEKMPIPKPVFIKFVWDTCKDKIKLTIHEDWTTYGIKIAEKSKVVTISDLCNQLKGDKYTFDKDIGTSAPRSSEDEVDTCTALFMGIRIAHGTTVEYQAALLDRAQKSYKAMKDASVTLRDATKMVEHLKDDPVILRLMSLVDLLLFQSMKVDKSKTTLGCFRLGTLITRFRDMASITSLSAASIYFAIDQIDFLNWTLDVGVRSDVLRLARSDPFLHMDGSYGPYFGGMHLSTGNPYSSTKNQSFFCFIHFAGSLGMNRRSMNARFQGTVNIHGPLQNAILFMYARSRKLKVAESLGREKVRIPNNVDAEEFLKKYAEAKAREHHEAVKRAKEQFESLSLANYMASDEPPKSDDIDQWRSYASRVACPTKPMIEWAISVIGCFKEVRDHTMASELRVWAEGQKRRIGGQVEEDDVEEI